MTREERNAQNYNNVHKIIDGVEYKQCSKCKEWLPMSLDYFYNWDQSKMDGLSSRCKSCCIIDMTVRRGNLDPEIRKTKRRNFYHTNKKDNETTKKFSNKSREVGKQADWQQKNPEKLKEYNEKRKGKNHKISGKEWLSCTDYFNNECAYCGLPSSEHFVKRKKKIIKQNLHKEHVDPNGSIYLDNCVPSCHRCNSSKHTATLDDWYNIDNPNYTEERYNKILKWITEDYKPYLKQRKIVDDITLND